MAARITEAERLARLAFSTTLGKRIKHARQQSRVSPKVVAAIMGITPDDLKDIEDASRPDKPISVYRLNLFAQAVGVDVTLLVAGL